MAVNIKPTSVPAQTVAVHYAAITPSDTADGTADFPDGPSDAIYVGGAGIVQAVRWDDTVVAFTVNAGQILNIKAKRVNNTSTTASLMVAMYVK